MTNLSPSANLPDLSLDLDGVFPAGMGYDPCPRISAMLTSGAGGFLANTESGVSVPCSRSKPLLRLVK